MEVQESEYGKITSKEVILRHIHYYDEKRRGIDESQIGDLLYRLVCNILCKQQVIIPGDSELMVIEKKIRNSALVEISEGFK